MKKNQDGFIGVAFAIAFAAIGVATVTVQESQRANNANIHNSRMAREKEKIQDSALNAAARYKALLAERKDPATGQYIPGIYPTDYFASPENWEMKRSSATGGSKAAIESSYDNRRVILKAGTSVSTVLEKSAQIFNQESTASNAAQDKVEIEIANLKLAEPGEPGAGILVKYADIRVRSTQADGRDATPVIVRVPMQKPIPHDLKVFYRQQNETVWHPFTSNVSLPDAAYEFKVNASGIMTGVKFVWNGTPIYLGFDPNTGRIDHAARSYEADNVQIGPILAADFGDVFSFL